MTHDTSERKLTCLPQITLSARPAWVNGNLHYVGKFSLYLGETDIDPMFPDKLIRFRVDPAIADARYVCRAMNARDCRAKIESFCATTAGNIGISETNLKILCP